jgi:hypothetical protein
MNTRNFGGSLWLLLFGTATVLLIGAFARFDANSTTEAADVSDSSATPDSGTNMVPPSPAAAPVVGPKLPADLSPGLADVIKLAQARVGDDTLLSYIQNTGLNYNPSADELLYLSDIGVSQSVLAALVKRPVAELAAAPAATNEASPVPAPIPAGSALAGPAENMIDAPLPTDDQPAPVAVPQNNYFYDSLAPYGSWQDTGAGYAWQPSVAAVDPGWTPYVNRGHWAWTDDGWCWVSDYSWGWAPFHYGRWSRDPRLGWLWVPGRVWSPAWVAWRNTDGFAGWAALPPGVLFRPGVGLFTVSGLPGLSLSFGINADWFTFVPHGQFLGRNLARVATTGKPASALFAGSKPVNNYTLAGGRILNAGVGVDKIAAATKAPVRKLALKEVSSEGDAGAIGGGAKSLAVYRPTVGPAPPHEPAGVSAKPLLINGARPLPERLAEATPPSYNPAPNRTGFTANNFAPAPPRTSPPLPAPTAMVAARPSYFGSGDTKAVAIPRQPAPVVSYPSFGANQPGYESAPSYGSTIRLPSPPPNPQRVGNGTGFGSSGFGTPREAPAYGGGGNAYERSAPSYPAPAPGHNNGGGAASSGSSSSSTSSSASNKNSK